MDLRTAGLHEQPFKTYGRPAALVSYAAHHDALKTLEDACRSPNGLCLLQGPALAGKTTLIQAFIESFDEERAIAVIDADDPVSSDPFEEILR
ncbi:MAG: hypothetical protein GTO41_26730, partial [Burkholderiales bacterium]|nr:hypothetical protein [Burkholderiales bacterium]